MTEERRKSGVQDMRNMHDSGADDKLKGGAASRARNRTVMLTPDVTGHVRSLLNHEQPEKPAVDPVSQVLGPVSGSSLSSGVPPLSRGVDYGTDLPVESEVPSTDPKTGSGARSGARTMFLDRGSLPPSLGASQPVVTVSPASSGKQGASGRQEPPVQHAPIKAFTQPTPFAAVPQAQAPQPQVVPQTPIVGFLVSFDKDEVGEVYEVRSGRWLLTSRQTDHGDFILVDDETISPLHAIIRASRDGKIQILDQLSEFGTGHYPAGSEEEREISGTMVNVVHGDTVRFGKRHFVVVLVPRTGASERKAPKNP